MARVTGIEMLSGVGKLHPSEVRARVKVFGEGTIGPIVQIETFGSLDREIPGKLSQTLQFDKKSDRELLAILQKAIGS